MNKGKIKKGVIFLCSTCREKYKLLEDLDNYDKSTGKIDMPDFFGNLFKGKL